MRELTEQEVLARDPGTDADPTATTAYELPNPPNDPANSVLLALGSSPATPYDMSPYILAEKNILSLNPNLSNFGYHVYELVFQGQAHDVPISLSVLNAADEQWVPTQTVASSGAVTTTWTLQAAGSPVAAEGDYSGVQGSAQYNASVAVSSAGNMVVTYTDQALQTDGAIPLDANGNNTNQNIYYEQLAESTDTAGPRVVAWTSGNGVSLINGGISGNGTATGVNAQYFVLTFDEPLMSGDPATVPDSVYDLANYQLYNANGNLISNAITAVSYGLSDAAQMSATDGHQPRSRQQVGGDSHPGRRPFAGRPQSSLRRHVHLENSQRRTGLLDHRRPDGHREHLRHAPESDRLQPHGIGFFGHDHAQHFKFRGGEPGSAGPGGDRQSHQYGPSGPANRSRGGLVHQRKLRGRLDEHR